MFAQLGAGETMRFQEVFLQLDVRFRGILFCEIDDSRPVLRAGVGEVEFEDFGDLGGEGGPVSGVHYSVCMGGVWIGGGGRLTAVTGVPAPLTASIQSR